MDSNLQCQPHVLLRFEVQLAEHCNLNCRNCMHYAPLANEEFLDLAEYEKDINRLSQLFDGEVEWIRLMGGEPLLHPQLIPIIKMTREYFKYGHIIIVSNGILLPKMGQAFWQACKDCSVEIKITKYPISIDYKGLFDKASKEKVSIGFYGEGFERRPTMWRFPIDIRGDFDPVYNFYRCSKKNRCLTLRKGKMYTCATSAHAYHLKEYYDLPIAYSSRNGVDIYAVNDAEELMEKLSKPKPFCRYCDYGRYEEYEDDWGTSIKDLYEWVSFRFTPSDINYLQTMRNVYIFGAGNWGRKTLEHLEAVRHKIKGFIVTNASCNPEMVDGFVVTEISNITDVDTNDVCLIAVNGSEKKEIQHLLRKQGFKRIIPIMAI